MKDFDKSGYLFTNLLNKKQIKFIKSIIIISKAYTCSSQ